MNQTKNMTHAHTPGPWKVTDEGSQIVIQTFSTHPTGTLARVYRKDKRAHANAHLIAAAPELLEALQMLSSIEPSTYSETCPYERGIWETAKDAIAKAIGKGDS